MNDVINKWQDMTKDGDMNAESEYMSLEEVAGKMGVKYLTIYRLVKSGELPAVRLGKQYRVSKRELEGYLEGNRNVKGSGVCSVCGTAYRTAGALEQRCESEGCGEKICFDCWMRRGVRRCPLHGGTGTGGNGERARK